MNPGRFDERCPHCEAKVDRLYEAFVNADYQTDFRFDCKKCGKDIQCDVHQVPEFELSKPQTVEEYKAMVAKCKEIVEGFS